jgi:ketosteroid isomerase-like protein
MTTAEAYEFALEWVRNFNARDLEAVLSHFAEDAEFTSPRALALTGKATLHSRRELGDYWRAGLASIKSIRFTLDHVINDESSRRAVIVYVAEIDGRKMRAAEFFEFEDSLRVIRGEGMYGAEITGEMRPGTG